jgi:ABC-type dipeptide/oligopeptide/nickel transport system permease subunit
LLFSGFVGLTTYLIFISQVFLAKPAKPFFIALTIYFIWTMFNPQSIVQLILFWSIVGLTSEARTHTLKRS